MADSFSLLLARFRERLLRCSDVQLIEWLYIVGDVDHVKGAMRSAVIDEMVKRGFSFPQVSVESVGSADESHR